MGQKRRGRSGPRAAERKHEVKAELGNFTLAKAKSALTLKIYSRKKKVGELQIGRGSLYWWGAHRQKAKRLSWRRVADLLDDLAYGSRR